MRTDNGERMAISADRGGRRNELSGTNINIINARRPTTQPTEAPSGKLPKPRSHPCWASRNGNRVRYKLLRNSSAPDAQEEGLSTSLRRSPAWNPSRWIFYLPHHSTPI